MVRPILFFFTLVLVSCNTSTQPSKSVSDNLLIDGTWRLVSAATIQQNDTTKTDYTTGRNAIKMLNGTHFAFFSHDLAKGKDSLAAFASGSGRYTIEGNQYHEHLEYCNFREWEDRDFDFTLTIKGDTLVQQGLEKLEDVGVDRIIIETYVRLK